jgi:L-lysine 2,3-aminomutase
LLDLDDQDSALRKTVVPRADELIKSQGESEDPLSEEKHLQ